MKKLKPKAIIGLSTTVFLFLLLMSSFYLNDQVEYNVQAAEWELKDEYQIGGDIPAEFDTQQTLTKYSYETFDGNTLGFCLYLPNDGSYSCTSSGYDFNALSSTPTNKLTIINDSINIENPDHLTLILFYDINNNYLGFYESEETNRFGNQLPQLLLGKVNNKIDIDGNLEIPNNAEYFVVQAANFNFSDSDGVIHSVTYTELFNNDISYYELTDILINPTQSAIDSYQVFENIRNNATTVNPLGFMKPIMDIPATALGYLESFTNFLDFNLRQAVGLDDTPSEFMDRTDRWYFNIFEWLLGTGD